MYLGIDDERKDVGTTGEYLLPCGTVSMFGPVTLFGFVANRIHFISCSNKLMAWLLSVVSRDLFYNQPVRRKYMQSRYLFCLVLSIVYPPSNGLHLYVVLVICIISLEAPRRSCTQ